MGYHPTELASLVTIVTYSIAKSLQVSNTATRPKSQTSSNEW